MAEAWKTPPQLTPTRPALQWRFVKAQSAKWCAYAVDIPLSEEAERYEVDIMQGATVKRTFTGLTTLTTIYTSAQQVTDFGSAQASILVNVYQMSAAVGRGFAGVAMV